MKSKLILLLVLYPALLLFEACRCEEVQFPYYDFDGIAFTYSEGTEISTEATFRLIITETGREFLAQEEKWELGLITKAYALTQCPVDGINGRKFPVVNLEITSNADFSSDLPAGTSLKSVFFMEEYDSQAGESSLIPLTEVDDLNQAYSFSVENEPTASSEHVFTLTLTKENGEIISAETSQINWL